MAQEPLIPEGQTSIDTSANFRVSPPVAAQVPPEAKDWDDFQAHMRRTTRPEDKGETQLIPCITARGARFTAKVYKAKRKEWETEETFAARQGRVQELCDYRFPGDGMGQPHVDVNGQPHTCDEIGVRIDPRTGRRGPGKKENGDYTWPEEIQDALQRKSQIMKTFWHRDLSEYCGRPLPDMIRASYAEEVAEFRAWKEQQAKKPEGKKPAK
jgi:hypothetical protein